MSEEEPIRPSSQNFLLNKNALIQLQVRFIIRYIVARIKMLQGLLERWAVENNDLPYLRNNSLLLKYQEVNS